MPTRKRPENRYELFTCAVKGHVLVGGDAELVTADDALVVRDSMASGGAGACAVTRGPVAVPDPTATQRVPSRDEIELPLAGPGSA